MPKIRFVTLDCAGTLVRVHWQPGRFAVDCARKCGLELEPGPAEATYLHLLQSRWGHYQQLNQTRDPERLDDFWRQITEDWLAELRADGRFAGPIFDQAWHDLYGEGASQFELFEDVRPMLAELKDRGIGLAVLSNWDYSLHRVLRLLDLAGEFAVVAASLEEGVEKPDRRLFEIVLDRLRASAHETLHVGDDPIDDVQGAREAGLHPCLIDRGGEALLPRRVVDLRQIGEVLDWIG